MKPKVILKLANKYYLLSRAVPLDEVIITPIEGNEYYHPEITDELSPRPSNMPWEESEEMSVDFAPMDLPPIEDFRKHYKDTTLKYRIIYSISTHGLQRKIPISLDHFKREISNHEERLLNLYSKESEKIKKETDYLLENFDNIFKNDAINIIANKYSSSDLTGPLAVDHDLGHLILDKYEDKIKDKDNYAIFWTALNEDYKTLIVNESGEEENRDNLMNRLNSQQVLDIITWIISSNNLIPGSVSDINLKKNTIDDFLADLVVNYNLSGETLQNIKLYGIDMPLKPLRIYGPPGTEAFLKPKNSDKSIPNLEKAIRDIVSSMELEIAKKLNFFVGKVICLW